MTVTLADAKERIRKFAEEKPEFVYERPTVRISDGSAVAMCRYFTEDGEPSCIVGHAFADELRQIGGWVEGRSAYSVFSSDIDADRAAANFLADVQVQQDTGVPWGAAYQYALRQR